MLLQVETVKFALDWQRQLATEGGRSAITAFYKSAFVTSSAYAEEFAGLSDAAAKTKFAQLQRLYRKWCAGAWQAVTARNHLLKLYNMVCRMSILPFLI